MGKIRINSLYPEEGVFGGDVIFPSGCECGLEYYLSSASSYGDEPYINDFETEKDLDNILKKGNSACFLIGFRGTGKTTFLRHYFNISKNTVEIQDGTVLLMPVLGTGETKKKNPIKKMEEFISSACEVLEKKYKKIIPQFYSDNGVEEFYQYISDTKGNILQHLSYSENFKISDIERKKMKLDRAQKEERLPFEISRLKFYLTKYCSNIRKIVFILDGIESIYKDAEAQKELANLFFSTYECLINYSRNEHPVGYQVQAILSVRHITYRILKDDSVIEKYMDFIVWKKTNINIVELFNRRFQTLNGKDLVVDESRYTESVASKDMLVELSKKFGSKYSDMISKLCFYNIDQILESYEKIIGNVTWIQKKEYKYSNCQIKNKGYLFTNITCIRALACGNEKVYRNKPEGLIPNILYNTRDDDYGTLILMIMKYYLRQYTREMEYGGQYIVLKDQIDLFEQLFGKSIREELITVISYMCQTQILRKSALDTENYQGEKYTDRLGSESKLYITTRGAALWDMLKNDSVLLELCREDMYRDYSKFNYSPKTAYDLVSEGHQDTLFMESLFIIKDLFRKELEFYKLCVKHGMKEVYKVTFGKKPVVSVALEGVNNSIQYAGCQSQEVQRFKKEIENDISMQWREVER